MSRSLLCIVTLLTSACGSPDSDGNTESCDTPIRFWSDMDGDGYGDPMTFSSSCEPPAGTVDNDDDCDDQAPDIHPGVEETCNGIDDDCDGRVDANGAIWYLDEDGDGFGTPVVSQSSCTQPDHYVANNTDCDDNSSLVFPGATELCNGVDDDCEGGIDEDFDADGDGYLSALCSGNDCDDTRADAHPGALDICGDGIDGDCVGGDPLCGSFEGEISLTDADSKVYSVGDNEEFGRLIDTGDVNGDGEVDALVATEYLNGTGGGYILYGPVTGTHVATEGGYQLAAPSGVSYCGRSISVGDLNGDGFDDVGFGAPYSAEVFVEFGPVNDNIDLADADLHADGHNASLFGHGHDIEDINDDGQADLIIGSYEDNTGASAAGAIFINYGPLDAGELAPRDDYDVALWGFSPNLYAGRIVRAGGDFNGDGVTDLMLQAFGYSGGAPSAGAAFVEYGPIDDDVDLEDVDAILAGESPNSWSGHSIGQGDINGDGLSDAAVGAPYASEGVPSSGSAYVEFSPFDGVVNLAEADIIVRGTSNGAMAGNTVGAGDTNNDGFADLMVGAPGDSFAGNHAGAAFFFYGPLSGTVTGDDSNATLRGENDGDQAGTGLILADLDHNGAKDLIIGSPYDSTSGHQGGAIYTVFGDD